MQPGDVLQDFRIALRSLLRAPVLTVTIVMTVGFGLGATTAIFSAVNAALLRPLPYRDPQRLVRIYTDSPPFTFRFSVADYLALDAQQTHFERIAAYTDRSMTYSDGEVAELVRGRMVSWSYFGLLGITPARGRDFDELDGRPGGAPSVIVSHGFWQERLGSRADVIGRPLRLDGADYELAGVLPAATGPLERGQHVFVAAQFAAPPRRGPFLHTVLGRLRAGADAAAAASELRAINRRIFPVWQASYQDDKATWSMTELKTFVSGDVHTAAVLALTAVGLVWLIACANASNLLIARVTGRRRELAVRVALGASRVRVVGHLLVESALLAAGSVGVGVALAWGGVGLLRGAGASYFPRMEEVTLGPPVTWVLAGLTLVSALIFGLIPALHGTGGPVDESLRTFGRSTTGNAAVRHLRRGLVASQFAIATPLLIVAGLLLTSLNALKHVDLGFDTRGVVTGSIRLPASQYAAAPGRAAAFWDEAKRRAEALPGVSAVAFADGRPPDGVGNINNFDLEDFPTGPGRSQPATPWLAVTPDYFRVLGLALLEGRLLDERDAQREYLDTVLVDAAWAKRFFPHGSAVGKRFREGGCTTCPWTTVVGVVSAVRYTGLDQPDQGTVYTPLSGSLSRFLVVRTEAHPAPVLAAIRQVVRQLEPAAPLSNVATIDELVALALARPQSLSLLVASFAAIALVLSLVGIYGVMAYYVQQHSKDIGIRVALGGRSADIMRLVLGQGMRIAAGGIVAGLVLALLVTRLVSRLLFGVGAGDASTFAGVTSLLLAVALVACLVPLRRALGVQPAAALRDE